MTFIDFVQAGSSASRKTARWVVYAKGGGQLGSVSWYPRWRCYAFFPQGGVFERGCLREIADFCEKETQQHRARKRDELFRQASAGR